MDFPKVKNVVNPDILLVCFLGNFNKLTMRFFSNLYRVRFMVQKVVTLYLPLPSDLDLDIISWRSKQTTGCQVMV